MCLITDIHGSRIIFDGPHKVFTECNYKGVSQSSHGIFDTMVECEEDLTMRFDVPYSILVDKQTGIEI